MAVHLLAQHQMEAAGEVEAVQSWLGAVEEGVEEGHQVQLLEEGAEAEVVDQSWLGLEVEVAKVVGVEAEEVEHLMLLEGEELAERQQEEVEEVIPDFWPVEEVERRMERLHGESLGEVEVVRRD